MNIKLYERWKVITVGNVISSLFNIINTRECWVREKKILYFLRSAVWRWLAGLHNRRREEKRRASRDGDNSVETPGRSLLSPWSSSHRTRWNSPARPRLYPPLREAVNFCNLSRQFCVVYKKLWNVSILKWNDGSPNIISCNS